MSKMESNDSKQGMQSQSASLCKAGCGFYGSQSSDGYCSVCFKEKLQRRLLLTDVPASTPPSSSLPPTMTSDATSSSDPSEQAKGENAGDAQTANSESAGDVASPGVVQPAEVTSSSSSDPTVVEASQLPPISETAEPLPSEPLDLRNKSTAEAKDNNQDDKAKAAEGEASKKKNRCFVCKKKVGLTGFGCRCGGIFCGLHRYSDTHDCKFDYREQGQLEIRKNNPKVTFQKVAKI